MEIFKGLGTALVTPFDKNGVDLNSLRELVSIQIESKVDALIVCGTTGEASTMSLEEKIEVVNCCIEMKEKYNSDIKIIVGTGSNDTKKVIEFNDKLKSYNIDGLLIVTPYYNKTTEEGIVVHYKEIAKNTKLPIILYNVPSRTGVNMSIDSLIKLSKVPNIVGIKEASSDITRIGLIKLNTTLDIYTGCDELIVSSMSMGAIGVISVISNAFPKEFRELTHEFESGNIKRSTELQLDFLKLIMSIMSEVNPIGIKKALELMGFSSCNLRLPLVKMSRTGTLKLQKNLKKHLK